MKCLSLYIYIITTTNSVIIGYVDGFFIVFIKFGIHKSNKLPLSIFEILFSIVRRTFGRLRIKCLGIQS